MFSLASYYVTKGSTLGGMGDGLVRVVAGPLEENYPVIACGAFLDRRTRSCLL